jgi:hypothetical protein
MVKCFPSCKSVRGRTLGIRMSAVRKKYRRGCAPLRGLASFLTRTSYREDPSFQGACAGPFVLTSVCDALIYPSLRLNAALVSITPGPKLAAPAMSEDRGTERFKLLIVLVSSGIRLAFVCQRLVGACQLARRKAASRNGLFQAT